MKQLHGATTKPDTFHICSCIPTATSTPICKVKTRNNCHTLGTAARKNSSKLLKPSLSTSTSKRTELRTPVTKNDMQMLGLMLLMWCSCCCCCCCCCSAAALLLLLLLCCCCAAAAVLGERVALGRQDPHDNLGGPNWRRARYKHARKTAKANTNEQKKANTNEHNKPRANYS